MIPSLDPKLQVRVDVSRIYSYASCTANRQRAPTLRSAFIQERCELMYSRTIQAPIPGPVRVSLFGHNSEVSVTADPGCARGYVEIFTEASSGPSVKAIDELPELSGSELRVRLPEGVGGTGVTVMSGGGFSSTMISSGGDSVMTVNGQRIEVRGGRTYVNGVEIAGGESEGDPAQPIHLRAVVPIGSALLAKTHNGSIRATGLSSVDAGSHNGNVRATGLTAASRIKTHNGNVTVGAAGNHRPEVRVETHNGSITVLDDNLRLRPRTHRGDIVYPR